MPSGQQSEKADKLSPEQVVSVRSALQAVISSDIFAGSKRCQDFLWLVVEHALAGELDALPERMIGMEMFGRLAFNPEVVRYRRHAAVHSSTACP